jgi:hypothetical protein
MSINAPGFRKADLERSRAIARVREYARQRFHLSGDDTVTVAELACALPGCPPLETIITFWIGEQRHHLKLFKPATEVIPDDLPPGWYRSALAVNSDFEGDCC